MALLGQSIGENESGAGKKERIGEIVQAVADVGGGSEIDGEIDEKDEKKNHDAETDGRKPRSPVYENTGAGQKEDSAREIGPNEAGRNVTGREAIERDARYITGMKKMFDGKDEDRDADEIPGDDDAEGGAGRGLRVPGGARKSKSAAAEGEIPESDDPGKAAGWIGEDIGDVNQEHEKKEHDSEKSCGQPDIFFEGNAEGRGKESGADKEDPKDVSRNPGRDNLGDALREDEMISGKNGEGNSETEAAQGEDFVEAAGVREFSEEDGREANGKDQGSGEVGTKDSGRKREGDKKDGQMRRRKIEKNVAHSAHAGP